MQVLRAWQFVNLSRSSRGGLYNIAHSGELERHLGSAQRQTGGCTPVGETQPPIRRAVSICRSLSSSKLRRGPGPVFSNAAVMRASSVLSLSSNVSGSDRRLMALSFPRLKGNETGRQLRRPLRGRSQFALEPARGFQRFHRINKIDHELMNVIANRAF